MLILSGVGNINLGKSYSSKVCNSKHVANMAEKKIKLRMKTYFQRQMKLHTVIMLKNNLTSKNHKDLPITIQNNPFLEVLITTKCIDITFAKVCLSQTILTIRVISF